MRPLRVLYVTPAFAPAYSFGGPVRSLEGLSTELANLGASVRVLTTAGYGLESLADERRWQQFQSSPSSAEVQVKYLPVRCGRDVSPTLGLHALAAARWADVVHVNMMFAPSTLQGLLAAWVAHKPVFLSPRGALEGGSMQLGRTSAKQAWLRALGPLLRRAVFHAASTKEVGSIRRVLGVETHVVLAPNGTSLPTLTPLQQQGRPIVVWLGRMQPYKAVDRLIAALAVLRDRGIDAELQLAGPADVPTYEAQLRADVSRLMLSDRVLFRGTLVGEERDELYRRARVLCLPSHDTENFGNVVIEALSFARPVVASRHTPWSQLETRRCGRWVENTPESLAEALAGYLVDPSEAALSGERGRAWVAEEFTWSAIAQTMLEAYERQRAALHR